MIRSSLGIQLERASLFSVDEHGKRIPRRERNNWSEMRSRPSRAFAPALTAMETTEERVVRDGAAARRLASLTSEERFVFDLQDLRWREERELSIPADRLGKFLDEGWQFVSQECGRATVAIDADVGFGYTQIAELTGLSVRQVHSRVVSINRKLRGAR